MEPRSGDRDGGEEESQGSVGDNWLRRMKGPDHIFSVTNAGSGISDLISTGSLKVSTGFCLNWYNKTSFPI